MNKSIGSASYVNSIVLSSLQEVAGKIRHGSAMMETNLGHTLSNHAWKTRSQKRLVNRISLRNNKCVQVMFN